MRAFVQKKVLESRRSNTPKTKSWFGGGKFGFQCEFLPKRWQGGSRAGSCLTQPLLQSPTLEWPAHAPKKQPSADSTSLKPELDRAKVARPRSRLENPKGRPCQRVCVCTCTCIIITEDMHIRTSKYSGTGAYSRPPQLCHLCSILLSLLISNPTIDMFYALPGKCF